MVSLISFCLFELCISQSNGLVLIRLGKGLVTVPGVCSPTWAREVVFFPWAETPSNVAHYCNVLFLWAWIKVWQESPHSPQPHILSTYCGTLMANIGTTWQHPSPRLLEAAFCVIIWIGRSQWRRGELFSLWNIDRMVSCKCQACKQFFKGLLFSQMSFKAIV